MKVGSRHAPGDGNVSTAYLGIPEDELASSEAHR
jgi:hypothetical protein